MNIEVEKIKLDDAAKMLGMSPVEVRVGMRRNAFNPPIGRVKPSNSGKSMRYYVYKHMLYKYLGMEV